MVTSPTGVPHRLAVAHYTEARATIRRRRIRVASTRSAAVEVSIGSQRRKLTVARGRVANGVTTVRVSGRLPSGVVELRLRAVGDDGAIASHRLSVINSRELSLATAHRAALVAATTSAATYNRMSSDAGVCVESPLSAPCRACWSV